ncbi:tRNA pseudouridine(55) synthase TruB [Priestia filamentosa]|uniref:tRNA pseudouridine(55) synthase TruB n=1 Tax=Priestia filamentosa TaxID=1402861 RepID=UPI001FB4E219|nr:tRNA pseudouridine(55) synthase TruB [Priestia filamentosa]MED3724959.1 tRNA pseudouridine(55) synthase TruB [Priestia filamentosa]UOE61771.1 tRNA pseudouridine(55) synthase TruB [Priestia filamentosa]
MEGIIVIDKPKGMTSHDCVFKLRKILRTKKIGHTGTLDPEVTGVLPMCVGRATKVVEYLTASSKTYEGEVTFGRSTTTEDVWGEVVEEREVTETFTKERIETVFESLTGTIVQTPPMYSAVKVNGKRLYEYARNGESVERPSREVTIEKLEIIEENLTGAFPTVRFRVTCSKGTYVRTLAVMMGEALGYPAHMSYLRRIGSGAFTEEDCVTLEELSKAAEEGTVDKYFLSIEKALSHLPKWTINDTLAKKVKNGAVLSRPEEISIDTPLWLVLNEEGKLLALYKHHETKEGKIKPAKIIDIS